MLIRTTATLSMLLALASPTPAPSATTSPAHASKQMAGIGVFRLPAGLQLVTLEDHAQPKVAIDTWVLAGSRDGCPGVAEATADAIWLGGAHSLNAALRALGGSMEMQVTPECAHFSVVLPADKLDQGLALVGGALAAPDWKGLDMAALHGLLLKQANFAAADPYTQADGNIFARLGETDWAIPVAGTPAADATLTVADLQDFYARHYLPGRTKVVLVGDFTTGTAVGQVVRGDAALLKLAPPVGAAPTCPAASATALPSNWVEAATLGPQASDASGQATMAVLAQVITAELSSRLSADAFARWRPTRGRGILTITVADAAPAAAESAIRALAFELQNKPVPLDVYTQAVQAELRANARENDTLMARAASLGFFAAVLNDPRRWSAYPDLVSAVGREDLLDAARQYLGVDSLKVMP